MRRPPVRRSHGALAIVVWTVACARTSDPTRSTGPTNACPSHPCAAYHPGSDATCVNGACVESAGVSSRLLAVVTMPDGSATAANVTFGLALGADTASDGGTAPVLQLTPVKDTDGYIVLPDVALLLGSNVGQPPFPVSLPVHVTYRALWSAGSSSPALPADGGASASEAASLGLPVDAPAVDSLQWPFALPIVNPSGGPGLIFVGTLQRGVTYERTVAPAPPFDQAFPPAISVSSLERNTSGDLGPFMPDTTELPRFDLSRADGKALDGWVAYLRESKSKRPLSPIKPLSGTSTPDGGLLLPTNHHSTSGDGFQNAELVLVPPADPPTPTGIFPALTGNAAIEYLALPPPLNVSGRIAWTGSAVPAELHFIATGIYAAAPTVDQGDGGLDEAGSNTDAGPTYVLYPTTNYFEYEQRDVIQPDPAGTSLSPYTVSLPAGTYRVIVTPLGSLGRQQSITAYQGVDTGMSTSAGSCAAPSCPQVPDIPIDVAPTLTGTVETADGRPLSDTTVEAVPVQCAPPINDPTADPFESSSCLPRFSQTLTDANGRFELSLDRGTYLLQVEPSQDTHFPWFAQSVDVEGSADLGMLTAPLPVRRSATIVDPQGRPMIDTVVRIIAMSPTGPAVEVGRTMTDATGHFEVYLDPAVQ